MAPTLYFMVGIPASGKTTCAAYLQKTFGCVAVCPDTIRVRDHVASARAFQIARKEVQDALEAGRNVVFDATNTIRRWRTENIAVGTNCDAKVVCVLMDTPIEECLRRHHIRQQQGTRTECPDGVLERMFRQLADNMPSLDEGFTEIKRITPRG